MIRPRRIVSGFIYYDREFNKSDILETRSLPVIGESEMYRGVTATKNEKKGQQFTGKWGSQVRRRREA